MLIVTGTTSTRTEAANTTIKHTGPGFRNGRNYRYRVLPTSPARVAA